MRVETKEERTESYKTQLYCFKKTDLDMSRIYAGGYDRICMPPGSWSQGASGSAPWWVEDEYCCLKVKVGEGGPMGVVNST